MKNLMILLIAIFFINCNNKQNNEMTNTPLITVIKLKSAEAILDFEEAKKYIDLQKVFEENSESRNIEKEWKEMLTPFYNIGNDKKFTNQFKYFNYNINENVEGDKAKVSFEAHNKEAQVKKIIYFLDKLNDMWIVIDIHYEN
ncbi:MAG: hypothetical protein AAFX55_20220 [Bacteroidota bacterium]